VTAYRRPCLLLHGGGFGELPGEPRRDRGVKVFYKHATS